MNAMTIAPEWTPPARTNAEWARIAADHVAGLPATLSPAQDWALFDGLGKGYSLDHVAAELVVAPHVARARFRELRDGMLVVYGRNEVFPLAAQEALAKVLRDRAAVH